MATAPKSAQKTRINRTKPVISVVLPAFNEAQNIGPMADALSKALAPLGAHEIIFVNDGSRDQTLLEIKLAAKRLPAVRFVSFTRNFGHQAALRAGLKHATGQAVVLMDCDFQCPPEVVPEMVARWREGFRIVTTRRADSAQSSTLQKRVMSRLYYQLLNAIGDIEIEPGSQDFVLLDRGVVDLINRIDDQQIVLRGFVRWLGYPSAVVDYRQAARRAGETKFTLRRMLSLGVAGVIAHSMAPLRLATFLAAFFALIGLALLAYSLLSFVFGWTVAGWTSTMSVIVLFGAGQFFVLGIIGEYVGNVVRRSRHWPAFVVDETDGETPTG